MSKVKEIHLYNVPSELVEKIDCIAKKNNMSRSQLVSETLDRVFTEDPDFMEKKRLSELINDTHSMISVLGNEIKQYNDNQQIILQTLIGE